MKRMLCIIAIFVMLYRNIPGQKWPGMNSFSGNQAYRPYFLLAQLKTFTVVTSPLGSSVFDVQVRVLLPAPKNGNPSKWIAVFRI